MLYKIIISLILPLLVLTTSCREEYIRKEVSNGDITVRWCYFSSWRDYSPDIIEVKRNLHYQTVFKAEDVITDIALDENQIVIYLYKPERGIIYEEYSKDSIWSYSIKSRRHENYQDYIHIPEGKK